MKTVCFYPTNQKRTNHFLYNLSNLLESSGKFKCIGYKEIKKECPRQIFSADVYHINWFDQSKDVLSFFKRLYFLLALKLKKKKIVWTIHNVQSHIKTPFYNRILFKLLVRFSDVIQGNGLHSTFGKMYGQGEADSAWRLLWFLSQKRFRYL